MARLLRGAPVAEALTGQLAARVEGLRHWGVTPTLAIVRVGARAADLSYERGATKRCAAAGIAVRGLALPADCDQGELMAVIERVNADDAIHGCLLLRPLPDPLDESAACAALSPAKDVDCITGESLFGVFANRPVGFPPCTAEACVQLLDHYGHELTGASVVVVGRSLVVGRPVSMMLQARDATVTMCHARTRDLAAVCRSAEIVVVATGHPGTVGTDAVGPHQTIVDVGINWDDGLGRLCGDVAFDEVEPIVGAITPVPGGVGSITTAVLAKHVVEAAERAIG